jgi:hypothetical protein
MNPDAQFERDLERWLQAEAPATAPAGLHAAVIDRARTRRQRPGWATSGLARWFGRNRGLTLFAAGALLLVGGAMAAGSGVVRLPSFVQPVPVPTNPVAVTSPTASPTNSPAPTEAPVVTPTGAASWAATGSMATPRYGHTATLLPSGQVLVAGGYSGSDPLVSAELYDPASGTWTATGSMAFARGGHTATLLQTGKVLVAGCAVGPGGAAVGSAELYDPASGTWTATGDMVQPRCLDFTATLLPDGRVLVAGGRVLGAGIVATAELYDPSTGTWSPTGSMTSPRSEHTATLLPDGTVLVAGGTDHQTSWDPYLATAELYNPADGTWTATGSLGAPHGGDVAQLLPDGRVLVNGVPPELYDPDSRSWTAIAGKVIAGWVDDVLLADGRVLALGAFEPGQEGQTITPAYLFDPGAGSWTPAGKLGIHRAGFTATLLLDGRVLVVGGFSGSDAAATALASAELYDPGTGQ